MPSQYIDPRYAPNNGYQPPVAEIAQAAQNPQHPANPSHPKVSEMRSRYRGLILMDAAWRMGWQDWCQARERRHFRRWGYYGVGFGEFHYLKVSVLRRTTKTCFTDLFHVF